MTAVEIVQRLSAAGHRMTVDDEDRLIVRPRPDAALSPEIRAAKDAIVALLREQEAVPLASDAVAAAARLLRVGKWAPEPAPCRFHIGYAGETCRRCGADWQTHMGG